MPVLVASPLRLNPANVNTFFLFPSTYFFLNMDGELTRRAPKFNAGAIRFEVFCDAKDVGEVIFADAIGTAEVVSPA